MFSYRAFLLLVIARAGAAPIAAALQSPGPRLELVTDEADIALEETRRRFVDTNAANTRVLAEAEAHRVGAVMAALKSTDPRVVQALAREPRCHGRGSRAWTRYRRPR